MLVSEASEYIPCQTIAVIGRRRTLPVPRTSQKSQQTMPHDVFMAPLLEVRAWLLRPGAWDFCGPESQIRPPEKQRNSMEKLGMASHPDP